MDRSRHPVGTPAGGRFAPDPHAEAMGVTIDDDGDEDDWGEVTVHEGSRTPWGAADVVYRAAPGIAVVSCPGHGGVKLSPERNRAIHPALRNRSGWYEEDCEAAIAGMVHPEAFSRTSMTAEDCAQRVREYFPDEYEEATGETVTAEDSSTRAQGEWEQNHAGEEAVLGASRTDDPDWVAVTVAPVGTPDGAERVLRVPTETYHDEARKHPHGRYPGRWLAGDDNFADITPTPEPKVAKTKYHGVSTEGISEAQANLVDRDLRQRWRGFDGEAAPLGDIIETRGLESKGVMVENGRRSYYLVGEDSAAYPVSKATWSAVEAPDLRSDASRAATDLTVARDQVQAAERDWDSSRLDRARRAAVEAKERLRQAEALESDARRQPSE